MKQQMMGWQWHQLNHVQINCTSSQTDNSSMAASDHSIFYSPDALPDAQPTVKARRHVYKYSDSTLWLPVCSIFMRQS